MIPVAAVDVWSGTVTGALSLAAEAGAALSPEEVERAARFHRHGDSRRFRARRLMLRGVLSRYLAIDPRRLAFTAGSRGKPALALPSADRLRFNQASSGDLILLAVGWDLEVGVDVERVRLDPGGVAPVARRHLPAAESARILGLPSADARAAAFFAAWTVREAVLKATGRGLSLDMDAFDVDARTGTVTGHQGRGEALGGPWWVRPLAVVPGYAAALAVEAGPVVIRLLDADEVSNAQAL